MLTLTLTLTLTFTLIQVQRREYEVMLKAVLADGQVCEHESTHDHP